MDEFQIVDMLKERFFLIRTQGNQSYFIDIKTGASDLGISHISGVLYSENHSPELVKKVTENLKDKLYPLCKETVYRPLCAPIVRIDGLLFKNQWVTPEVSPSSEDSTPFEEHLFLAMGDRNKVDYFLDLLAYRFQYPHQKKPHAVVYLYQAEGGNGKSLLATTLKHVFGETAVQIASEAKMNSGSKVQLWATTLLIAEEANVKRGDVIYDTIKTYSGTDEIFDDSKHAHFKKYRIPASLVMLSNRAPNFLEPFDRRFFVSEWQIKLEKEIKSAYFKRYVTWLETGGYAAIAGLLKRRLITRDMYAPVPLTEEKERAMSVGQDSCVREILDALDDQQGAQIFSADDFFAIFHKYGVKGPQIKHKLTEAGLKEHGSRLNIGSERFRPWHRKGETIVSTPGVGTFIRFEGQASSLDKARFKGQPL